MGIIAKIIGTKNERTIKGMQPKVQAIGAMEPLLADWSDERLAQRIAELRDQVKSELTDARKIKADLEKADINKVLDKVLVETFAIVRESGKRVLGMRHYDCQLIGGMVLNNGQIAEMKTGEGKTLVATLPAVLNALTGEGVHVVTVNDYLATRDAEWMGRLYRFLGLSTGVVIPNQESEHKKAAYQADITYGQNNEFGFDYLRDNMKFALTDYAQRGQAFCIVDEVDSILIDEARTPLIISGPTDDRSEGYHRTAKLIPQLRKDEHYVVDEKGRTVLLTEEGVERSESLFEIDNLYDPVNIEILHHINQALRGQTMFKRDRDYVVEGGEVVIVDEHTGRLMHGRRWSDGLHQAIEAKENVRVQKENQTLATVTFQNYFRGYTKLSGMTGTADTEAEEFAKIYNLDVVVIPTNKPVIRRDDNDLIYKTDKEKYMAIVDDIETTHNKGQPVLVGTVSVEKSEVLSTGLKRKGIAHHILNAKRHRDEASIVAQAGKLGSVTIATNMAGRGTDILLGGNPEHLSRQEVARRMGHLDEQVAEFGWLTGDRELINTERMAQNDAKDLKFMIAHEQVWQAEQERLQEEAAKKGDDFVMPDGPGSMEDVQRAIFEDRKAYYDQALAYYDEVLPQFEKSCSEEKQKVLDAGGLHIVGTERHESRRIDNQLRGRAGRQGDPGSSSFYLSLQDDLMRIFGSEKMIGVMERLGMEDGIPIEHKWVNKSIANAQKRVEGIHFDSRKNVIEYDDVMNMQRKSIYGLRREVLGGEKTEELILDLVEEFVLHQVASIAPEKVPAADWKIEELSQTLFELLGVHVDLVGFKGARQDLEDQVFGDIHRYYQAREEAMGTEVYNEMQTYLYLQTIDKRWKEHLSAMDHLREGIHLRGYGQKDPKQEYKKEGFQMFEMLMALIRDEVLEKVFKATVKNADGEDQIASLRREQMARAQKQADNMVASHPSAGGAQKGKPAGGMPQRAGSMPTGVRNNGQMPGASAPPAKMNRAQRRRMKSKERKGSKSRPSAGS